MICEVHDYWGGPCPECLEVKLDDREDELNEARLDVIRLQRRDDD